MGGLWDQYIVSDMREGERPSYSLFHLVMRLVAVCQKATRVDCRRHVRNFDIRPCDWFSSWSAGHLRDGFGGRLWRWCRLRSRSACGVESGQISTLVKLH